MPDLFSPANQRGHGESHGSDLRKSQQFCSWKPNRALNWLATSVILACVLSVTGVAAQHYTLLPQKEVIEHVIYDQVSQPKTSFQFYRMRVGKRYFTGSEMLIFKVMAEQFGSDPDIFISKQNTQPMNSDTSEWYCERLGSETCIVPSDQISDGDVFYFGVKCLKECTYKLRTWFTKVQDLSESSRTQKRFDSDSTQIFKYFIPFNVNGENTTQLQLKVEPEDNYSQLDMFLSLDSRLQIIEEEPSTQLLQNGKAIKFGMKDGSWCQNCFIYLILNIYEGQRHYITSQSGQLAVALQTLIATHTMVNPFQQECYQYFVLQSESDVRFEVFGYTGQYDTYAVARSPPSSPSSNRVIIRNSNADKQSITLQVKDRTEVDVASGTYFLCIYAFTHFSGYIEVTETILNKRIDLYDNQALAVKIRGGDYIYSRYTNSDFTKKGTITLHFNAENVASDGSAPEIYYTVCDQANPTNCLISEEQVSSLSGLTQAPSNEASDSVNYHFQLEHDPENCVTPGLCVYMFLFKNPMSNTVIEASIRMVAEFNNPGDVNIDKTYSNIVEKGEFIRYELNPITNSDVQPFIKKLSINLVTLQGDADLYVSLSNPNPDFEDYLYSSKQITPFDQVVIEDLGGQQILNAPIFISVFGEDRSQFEMSFEYETKPSYIKKLDSAVPIGEMSPMKIEYETEFEESLLKYQTWWSKSENRTVVFLADIVSNDVFFYTQFDTFPAHFKTSMHDVNDTISIQGNDPEYSVGGSYYIRVRPDFGVYDLMAKREYIYYMWAFSQAPTSTIDRSYGYDVLQLGQERIGFVNQTFYQDYIFHQVDMGANYTITLQRVPGMGEPVFYVKMVNSDYTNLARVESYHFNSQPVEGSNGTIQSTYLDKERRTSRWSFCDSVYHSIQTNGSQQCIIGVSVYCQGERQCGYYLKIEQQNYDSSRTFSYSSTYQLAPLPGPVLIDKYVEGSVENGNVNYYYFPFNNETTSVLVVLNKTDIMGQGTNGKASLSAIIQRNINDQTDNSFNYSTWNYPTQDDFGVESNTESSETPEIIEFGQATIQRFCEDLDGCALLLGVVGRSSDATSTYRLKGFLGDNRLNLNEPVRKEVRSGRSNGDEYDYYWFSIADTAIDNRAEFDYQISVGSHSDNVNPDLYVSLMHGRNPSEFDYDLGSDNQGSDSVTISSKDEIWERKGWKHEDGVLVVVAVKFPEAGEYHLVLTKKQDSVYNNEVEMLSVGDSAKTIILDSAEKGNHDKLFMLYNWGHRPIDLQVKTDQGNATLMASFVGQKSFKNNLYSATPLTEENSFKIASNSSLAKFTLEGSDCYSCWYMVGVKITDPAVTQYKISISQDDSAEKKFRILNKDAPQDIFLTAGFGQDMKFILDQTNSFQLSAQIVSGDITLYVGLDPETVGANNYIWKAESKNGLAYLPVMSTDDKFHMGTFYYVKILASNRGDAFFTIQLNQERVVSFIPNNRDYTFEMVFPEFDQNVLYRKQQFQTDQEQVKFHVFRLPGAASGKNAEVKFSIKVEALSEHFYPLIYLKKNELSSAITSTSELEYPSIIDSETVLGNNPFEQAGLSVFEYDHETTNTAEFVYYTVALYQQNWGLTDDRKSEYQIFVRVNEVNQVTPNVQSASPSSVGPSQSSFESEWIKDLERSDLQAALMSVKQRVENAFNFAQ